MNKKPIISLIAAMSQNRAIGLNNALPWTPIPADWDNLKLVTQGKRMIMGRKSYDNPHRIWSDVGNFVITRQKDYQVDNGFEVADSLATAFKKCVNDDEVFVLGGEEIFRLALPFADKIFLTIVHENFEGDTFFPIFDETVFDIIAQKEFKRGENTPYDITILTYARKFKNSPN
ncbi:Dihydrofolate reductase [Emticicia aquatica]|jgi:dihydrofolate reductase|uniref:Dihydrofolate reductase n=1 Tax=Emticicia aquatica TaxID=1681835 RepID=A0ABN8EZD8_9BACT|nr:dihydrofolate reductase [Emticicia aquatica]CAH0997994.1 Dihydrofolate reductase [Emticicia aquatica]